MKLKLLTLFITILIFSKKVAATENHYFVDSTPKPSTESQNVSERLSRLEYSLEIRSMHKILQESITALQKTKREYIDEVEAVLEKKLKLYDQKIENLKAQFNAAKKEIISKSEENIQHQFVEMKKEIKEELTKSTKGVIFETNQNIKKHLQQIKKEITDSRGKSTTDKQLEVIKKQLTQFQTNITSEIKECQNLPQDCRQVQNMGSKTSGAYRIHPEIASKGFLVWCDMTTQGGGWTYVINRFNGSQNFYLNWTDYKRGFGKISAEHWLGLEHLHELTNSKPNELLFELVDWDLKKVYAKYENFVIGSESKDYIIESVGNYSGNAGDCFESHVGSKFSTADHEHHTNTSEGCAAYFSGAWWYTDCYQVHLTGIYLNEPSTSEFENAIHWNDFHGYNYSLKEVKMMVRPREN